VPASMEHVLSGCPIGPAEFLDARKARGDEVLEHVGTKTPRYLYGFGSGLERLIEIQRALRS
jgi:hypothetical protein